MNGSDGRNNQGIAEAEARDEVPLPTPGHVEAADNRVIESSMAPQHPLQ